MARPMVKDDLQALRSDANKVLADITNISRHLSDVSKSRFGDIAGDVASGLKSEIESLSTRAADLNNQLKDLGQKVDTNVKTHPYSFIISALGIGYLLGKFIPIRGGS